MNDNAFVKPPRMGSDRYHRDITQAFEEGLRQGRKDTHKEVLTWLEKKYIDDPGRPDRGSPQGKALIQLAGELATEFTKEKDK